MLRLVLAWLALYWKPCSSFSAVVCARMCILSATLDLHPCERVSLSRRRLLKLTTYHMTPSSPSRQSASTCTATLRAVRHAFHLHFKDNRGHLSRMLSSPCLLNAKNCGLSASCAAVLCPPHRVTSMSVSSTSFLSLSRPLLTLFLVFKLAG